MHKQCRESFKIEEKYNQICKGITRKYEEMEARIDNIQSQTNEMHLKTISTLDEDKQQFDAIKQQCSEIMGTLYPLANEEQSESQNIQKFPRSTNNYLASTQPVLNIDDHSNNTNKTMPSIRVSGVKISKLHSFMIAPPIIMPISMGNIQKVPINS